MADILYLVKANRVREYHHQNLAIMAARDGDRIEITYADRWVQPGLQVAPGQGCALIIADSPYRRFQPLRWAVVEDADFTDRKLRLVVRLGAFILGGDELTERWAADADADLVAQRSAEEKTRPWFAFIDKNYGLRNPQGRVEQNQAWNTAVDGLSQNEFFTDSTPARLGEITRADGIVIEPGQAVPVGTEIRIPVELRSIDRAESHLEARLECDPEGSLEIVSDPMLAASGASTIRAVVRTPGTIRARLNLLPNALRASRPALTIEVSGVASTVESVPAPEATSGVEGVGRLVRRLQREAEIPARYWTALFEDFFVPWGRTDPDVVAAYAESLFAAGSDRELEAFLDHAEERSPRLDLLLLLASIRSGTASNRLHLLAEVDVEDDEHFEQLLVALDAAPPATLQAIVDPLRKEVLGDERKLTLIGRVLPRIRSDALALDLAEELAYSDPELGINQILTRWPRPERTFEPALALLVDFQVENNRVAPYARHWLLCLAESCQWDKLDRELAKVRPMLSARDRAPTFGAVALELIASRERRAAGLAFELLCEAANEACLTGQLDTAVELAEMLRGNLGLAGDDERRLAATALLDQIDEAVAGSEAVLDWRAKQATDRATRLMPHTRNKVLHLVGGLMKPWETDLERDLELRKLIHHESEKHDSPSADWAESTNTEEDIVVILWERIGHALSGNVEDACAKRRVTPLRARSGQRGLFDALESHFSI